MIGFEGRCAVVTGAAKGIGYATAKHLIEKGLSKIAIIDKCEEALVIAAKELSALCGTKVLPATCDVSSETDVFDTFKKIEQAYSGVDILVNNAGIARDGMFHKMSFKQWDDVIKVNLYGAFNCCRVVMTGMRERGYGRIVNISSVVAYGNAGQANYAASKAGLIGLTKTLAKEGARKGITVNAIAPDFINTPMMNEVPKAILDDLLLRAPMQRMGEPEEVAVLVAFLASEEASYVSGACIDCSGAFHT